MKWINIENSDELFMLAIFLYVCMIMQRHMLIYSIIYTLLNIGESCSLMKFTSRQQLLLSLAACQVGCCVLRLQALYASNSQNTTVAEPQQNDPIHPLISSYLCLMHLSINPLLHKTILSY